MSFDADGDEAIDACLACLSYVTGQPEQQQ
jgi:hypothetical protein